MKGVCGVKKSLSVVSIILIIIFILTACITKPANKDLNPEKSSSIDRPLEGDDPILIWDIKLSPEEAYDIFKKIYPKAEIKEMELDRKDNFYVYEIEGCDGNIKHEMKIDPYNGNVLKVETEFEGKEKGEILREDLAKIPELIEKALDDAGEDFQPEEWSVEIKRGKVVFEVDVIDSNYREIEYKYNLKTGDLIEKDI
jgi:uncharacterized membrane protein YkoI